MSNRIKGLEGSSIGASSAGVPIEQIRASHAVSTATAEARQSVDSVHITDSARHLSTLATAVQNSPDIDMQRVSDLQTAIGSGQYTVNAGVIADRLLQFEQDIGSAS